MNIGNTTEFQQFKPAIIIQTTTREVNIKNALKNFLGQINLVVIVY